MRTNDVVMFEEVCSIVLMIFVSLPNEDAGMSLWMRMRRMASYSFYLSTIDCALTCTSTEIMHNDVFKLTLYIQGDQHANCILKYALYTFDHIFDCI